MRKPTRPAGDIVCGGEELGAAALQEIDDATMNDIYSVVVRSGDARLKAIVHAELVRRPRASFNGRFANG